MAWSARLTAISGPVSLARFARMTAAEELGRLFSYRVELLSQDDKVDLLKLLGTPLTVAIIVIMGVIWWRAV